MKIIERPKQPRQGVIAGQIESRKQSFERLPPIAEPIRKPIGTAVGIKKIDPTTHNRIVGMKGIERMMEQMRSRHNLGTDILRAAA